jgi:hypothetical protein
LRITLKKKRAPGFVAVTSYRILNCADSGASSS